MDFTSGDWDVTGEASQLVDSLFGAQPKKGVKRKIREEHTDGKKVKTTKNNAPIKNHKGTVPADISLGHGKAQNKAFTKLQDKGLGTAMAKKDNTITDNQKRKRHKKDSKTKTTQNAHDGQSNNDKTNGIPKLKKLKMASKHNDDQTGAENKTEVLKTTEPAAGKWAINVGGVKPGGDLTPQKKKKVKGEQRQMDDSSKTWAENKTHQTVSKTHKAVSKACEAGSNTHKIANKTREISSKTHEAASKANKTQEDDGQSEEKKKKKRKRKCKKNKFKDYSNDVLETGGKAKPDDERVDVEENEDTNGLYDNAKLDVSNNNEILSKMEQKKIKRRKKLKSEAGKEIQDNIHATTDSVPQHSKTTVQNKSKHGFDPVELKAQLGPKQIVSTSSSVKVKSVDSQANHESISDTDIGIVQTKSSKSFLEKSRDRLNAARFRYINEQLYTTTGQEALSLFTKDQEAFNVYHEGFQSQVEKWPTNPVDVIIAQVKSRPKNFVVADFGCGDAKLARSVTHKVHSFDLVALNNHVTVCDISKVPLPRDSVDIAVFCLSLMGTNLTSYLLEASRVLKKGGTLFIAEVASRFPNLKNFVSNIEKLGYKLKKTDSSNKMFVLMDFKKTKPVSDSGHGTIKLKPCLYKKR